MNSSHIYTLFLASIGVCTDTRKITPGSIFFALKGDNFNGNAFAAKAIEQGCSYAVIDEPEFAKGDNYIVVEDVLTALQNLATEHRRALKTPIIGVTGSNGKTTTKELLRSVLSQKLETYATIGNLNNQIGVPLTLLGLTPKHQIAIIEMGASKPGDIKELADIAEPDFGLITSIGKAHLEGMGGIDGVVKTKGELFDFIRNNKGGVFVDSSNDMLKTVLAGIDRIVTYGESEQSNYIGEITASEPFLSIKWRSSYSPQWHTAESNLTGDYNFSNIMSAVAVGNHFGLSPQEIAAGIAAYTPDNNRAQFVKKGTNTLILDAYNANPTSMEASIRNFYQQDFPNKTLVLGEMMELGSFSDTEHRHILALVQSLGFTYVHFVGNQFYSLKNGTFHFWENASLLADYFKENKPQNSTILFKGSRKNRLESVAEVI